MNIKDSIEIPSDKSFIKKVADFSEGLVLKSGFTQDEADDITISVTEAVNNAIVHGNKEDIAKKVRVNFHITDEEIVIKVIDEGKGIDPINIKDPLSSGNILKTYGRGLHIIKNLMDSVKFFSRNKRSYVVMRKKRKHKT